MLIFIKDDDETRRSPIDMLHFVCVTFHYQHISNRIIIIMTMRAGKLHSVRKKLTKQKRSLLLLLYNFYSE